jgi:pimeloyl-ACP methyl ester carboxylesterase
LPAVAVLGNSFGCQVAVDLAVRHPAEHAAELVLALLRQRVVTQGGQTS